MGCIFCEFITGKRKIQSKNGIPFMALNKTKNTLSFLSMDFPDKEDGHVIVIPKKHFENLEDIPKYILHELIDHVILIINVLREKHGGCNVLLNDGKTAEQSVIHAHFHIIARDKGDKIRIEVWKRKNLSIKDFKKLHKSIKREIKRIKN